MPKQAGFFDVDDRLSRLTALGDQLLSFAGAVDFELFRPELARAVVGARLRACGATHIALESTAQNTPNATVTLGQ